MKKIVLVLLTITSGLFAQTKDGLYAEIQTSKG